MSTPEYIKMAEVIRLIKHPSDGEAKAAYPNLEKFETELQTGTYLSWDQRFNERMKATQVNTWLCTDTWVGVVAYFFDGHFCALSFQSARKSGIKFYWLNDFLAQEVRKFIRHLADQDDPIGIKLLNPDEDVSPDWLKKGGIYA